MDHSTAVSKSVGDQLRLLGGEHEIAAGADRQGAAGADGGTHRAGGESIRAKFAERECDGDAAHAGCGGATGEGCGEWVS